MEAQDLPQKQRRDLRPIDSDTSLCKSAESFGRDRCLGGIYQSNLSKVSGGKLI